MSDYDPHVPKIIARGVSIERVHAAYKHFGTFRQAARVCGVAKDTVRNLAKRYGWDRPTASLPPKASYNPKNLYSTFAKWHKAHAHDKDLPRSTAALAKLAGVSRNVAHCYFRRRRDAARKILEGLPNLKKLSLLLEDIEGAVVDSQNFVSYRYAIDRYSERAAIQGKLKDGREVTVLIPSIEQFAKRVNKSFV